MDVRKSFKELQYSSSSTPLCVPTVNWLQISPFQLKELSFFLFGSSPLQRSVQYCYRYTSRQSSLLSHLHAHRATSVLHCSRERFALFLSDRAFTQADSTFRDRFLGFIAFMQLPRKPVEQYWIEVPVECCDIFLVSLRHAAVCSVEYFLMYAFSQLLSTRTRANLGVPFRREVSGRITRGYHYTYHLNISIFADVGCCEKFLQLIILSSNYANSSHLPCSLLFCCHGQEQPSLSGPR